jgi:hypothetical protein
MNKKGQKAMSGGMIIAIAAIVILGVMYFGNQNNSSPTIVTTPATTTDCNQVPANPATVATGVDALVANSNVTPANYGFIVNGVYKGSTYTNPTQGDSILALADPTGNYLADVETVTAKCGNYPLTFKFKGYTNATVTAYADSGITSLTNNGGANNESAWTAGQTKVNKIRLVGAGQKSTGKIFTVVEYQSNSAPNISNTGVQLTCGGQALQQISIPSAVSSTNTNALRIGYEIPEISNGAVVDCYLSSQATASKVLGTGYIRISFYGEQKFIDADATIKEGIYDLNSNAKYQDSYTFVIGVT